MHIKENLEQNKNTTHRMGDNICKWFDQQGINLQKLLTAHAAQYQKNKQPNQKWGEDVKTYVQRNIQMAKKQTY